MKSGNFNSGYFLKFRFIISTFFYDFLFEPFRSGLNWVIALLLILQLIKLLVAIDTGTSPEVITTTEFHFMLVVFLMGYGKKLIFNFDK